MDKIFVNKKKKKKFINPINKTIRGKIPIEYKQKRKLTFYFETKPIKSEK